MGICMSNVKHKKRGSLAEPGYLLEPVEDVVAVFGCTPYLSYASASLQGWRISMEDEHIMHVFPRSDCGFFSILDGHGGKDIAKATEKHLARTLASHLPQGSMTVPKSAPSRPASRKSHTASASNLPSTPSPAGAAAAAGSPAQSAASSSSSPSGLAAGSSTASMELGGKTETAKKRSKEAKERAAAEAAAAAAAAVSVTGNTDEVLASSMLEEALRAAFISHDEFLSEHPEHGKSEAGSTCCSAFVSPRYVTFAHAGDSRAIFVRDGKVVHATNDHKPHHEVETRRIFGAGGVVVSDRVDGLLAVSRGFGDFHFKNRTDLPRLHQKVIPEPDVCTVTRLHTSFEFVLLACDGVWDVMSSLEAASFIYTQLNVKGGSDKRCGDVSLACEALVRRCFDLRSRDNISAIIVVLQPPEASVLDKSNARTRKRSEVKSKKEWTSMHDRNGNLAVPAVGVVSKDSGVSFSEEAMGTAAEGAAAAGGGVGLLNGDASDDLSYEAAEKVAEALVARIMTDVRIAGAGGVVRTYSTTIA